SSSSKSSGCSSTSVSSTPSSNSSSGCRSSGGVAAAELAHSRMQQQLLRDCEALLNCMGLAAAAGAGGPPVLDVYRGVAADAAAAAIPLHAQQTHKGPSNRCFQTRRGYGLEQQQQQQQLHQRQMQQRQLLLQQQQQQQQQFLI